MITYENYYQIISKTDINSLSTALQKGHELVNQTTENAQNWDMYFESPTIKSVIDKYFEKLESVISQNTTPSNPQPNAKSPGNLAQHKTTKKTEKVASNIKSSSSNKQSSKSKMEVVDKADMNERIIEEVKFIKRYLSLNGKSVLQIKMLNFINALQKAILERKIRKSSPYAKAIAYIQEKLIERYNSMGDSTDFVIAQKVVKEFSEIIENEQVYPSIKFIKRYINLNGKLGAKQKAEMLYNQIGKAVDKGKITGKDKYSEFINSIWHNLENFINNPQELKLKIEKNELNGLNGVLGSCNCHSLNGIEDGSENDVIEDWGTDVRKTETSNTSKSSVTTPISIMNSMDFANLHFDTLKFIGKWLKLIGNPSKQFTAMVFGKPKMGKSYLCMDFAGYLARNHGKVLYIAKEEGLDQTLQLKMNDKNVKHPNLTFADGLPDDLSPYQFVFFDSVNKLNYKSNDLEYLEKSYPQISMIYIYQTTKLGNFRGSNENQHNVDVVIEVPELGKAVQFGRFNQGGEINIFP